MCRSARGVKMTRTPCSSSFVFRITPGADAVNHFLCRHTLGWVRGIFVMPHHHFLSQPPLQGRVTLEQCAHAVPHHFARGRIHARFDFLLDYLSHIDWQGNAELLRYSHKLYSVTYSTAQSGI